MDSRDPSGRPPHLPHHHHPQPPPPSHPGVLLGQNQQHLPNNSYPLPNNNNSINPTTSAAAHSGIMHQQNPGFPFNSMAAVGGGGPKPLDHMQQPDGSHLGGGPGGFSIEPARKKRGRPRKYSPDNSIGLGLSPAPVQQIPSSLIAQNDSGGGGGGGGTPSSETPAKKHRGRPPGSVKRQLDALGAPGVGFTPHVITVNAGEDIASKIMAFSQQGPRTVCILSANGAICNVTLRQPAMSGGTVTYEGRFEIISLTGSFLLSDSNGGSRGRSGSLSVSLAGSDGRVLGGGVAGMLKAASPVQVVVGSFIADGKKSKSSGPSTPAPPSSSNMLNFGGTGTGASPSQGDSSDSGDEDNDDTSLNHGYGAQAGPGQPMPMYSPMGWPNSMKILPN